METKPANWRELAKAAFVWSTGLEAVWGEQSEMAFLRRKGRLSVPSEACGGVNDALQRALHITLNVHVYAG